MLPTDKKMILISIAATILVLALGAFMFLKDVVYYEKEQLYYIFAYGLLALGAGFYMAKMKYLHIIPFAVALIGILVFSSLKYDWRRDFIIDNNFALIEYTVRKFYAST